MAKLSEKIGYALGDAAAGGITWKVMSIAFPLFFTNVFGLTVADTATLMLIARMFDVVTDPLMGSLADRTIWAYTFYLLMMVVYTAVNVPYGSLLGVMTDDDNEKNQFSSFRMVGAYAMGFITLLSFPYLQKMVGGSDQHQYAVVGALLGFVATVGTLACGLLTKERKKPARAEKFSLKPFADLFRNRPWVILTLIGICMNFFNGFRYAVAGYMFEYCLHGDVTVSGLIINYTVFMTFGELTCMIACLYQVGRFQAHGVHLGSSHLCGYFADLLLHSDGSCQHLADGSCCDPDFHRYRSLLTAAVVDVCRCSRLCHREERHLVNRSYLLQRYDVAEVRYSHLRFVGSAVVGYRRLCVGYRCHRSDCHHDYRRGVCQQYDLGSVLSLPRADRADNDWSYLYLSD